MREEYDKIMREIKKFEWRNEPIVVWDPTHEDFNVGIRDRYGWGVMFSIGPDLAELSKKVRNLHSADTISDFRPRE